MVGVHRSALIDDGVSVNQAKAGIMGVGFCVRFSPEGAADNSPGREPWVSIDDKVSARGAALPPHAPTIRFASEPRAHALG